MKALTPAEWEEHFGAGEPDESYPRGRKPVLETDLVRETMVRREQLLRTLDQSGRPGRMAGLRTVVASTDVHEFAKFLLASTLDNLGARVIDAGINRDPEDIVKVAVEAGADAVVLTTHNGVARSFASKLVEEMGKGGLSQTPVFMGGVLNEDVDGSDIPMDVRGDLHELGIQTPPTIEALVESLGKLGEHGRTRDGS
jgi:methylmalonyl-CoA mutase cobalamin-binding domain/chain